MTEQTAVTREEYRGLWAELKELKAQSREDMGKLNAQLQDISRQQTDLLARLDEKGRHQEDLCRSRGESLEALEGRVGALERRWESIRSYVAAAGALGGALVWLLDRLGVWDLLRGGK